MREAFLIQMNDFDRLVEIELRRMLDPVVAARVPPRRIDVVRNRAPFRLEALASLELAPEPIPVAVVEPIVAALPAALSSLLP